MDELSPQERTQGREPMVVEFDPKWCACLLADSLPRVHANLAQQPPLRPQRVLRTVENQRFTRRLLRYLPQGIRRVRPRLHKEV